jgi:acetate kinase
LYVIFLTSYILTIPTKKLNYIKISDIESQQYYNSSFIAIVQPGWAKASWIVYGSHGTSWEYIEVKAYLGLGLKNLCWDLVVIKGGSGYRTI